MIRAISRNLASLCAERSRSTVSANSTGFASPPGSPTTVAPPRATSTSLSPAGVICWIEPDGPTFFASPPLHATLIRPAASPVPPMK